MQLPFHTTYLTRQQLQVIRRFYRLFPRCTRFGPIPVPFLLAFAQQLYNRAKVRNITFATMKSYIGALRNVHIYNGWSTMAFSDARVLQFSHFAPKRSNHIIAPAVLPRTRHIVTIRDFQRAVQTVIQSGFQYADVVILTASLVAFTTLARTYELLHAPTRPDTLSWDRVSRAASSDFRIALLHPKVLRDYTQVLQPFRLNAPINPHQWLQKLSELRVSVTNMWCLQDGTRIYTRDLLTKFAALANLNPNQLDESSFRAGGATYLISIGWSFDHLQLFGRWDSDAFKVYIRQLPDAFYRSHQ